MAKQDHDQRLKSALQAMLAQFVALVIARWVANFDFSSVEWLEQELFPDPPSGERLLLDKVARVRLAKPIGKVRHGLIHTEIDAGHSLSDLRRVMPRYHNHLRNKYGLPVLSLGLYLDTALQGTGWDEAEEALWGERLGLTRWPYLGLPGLDAQTYVESDNMLGVALSVLMKIPEGGQARLKLRAMDRVARAELPALHRFLLVSIIEAYLPLVGPHMQEYERLLRTEEFAMVRALEQTTFEKGEEAGQREMLRTVLEAKFGKLSATALSRIDACTQEQLTKLASRQVKAKSLADLGLEDAATE